MLTSMTTAADLLDLQEIDLALDAARARLAEIEEALGETEDLIEARKAVEESRENVNKLKAQQTDEELQVEQIRDKAKKVDDKLYSGTVTNPKELGDLHADFKMLNTQADHAEDKLLGTLVEIDEASDALSKEESAFAEVQARWESDQARMRAEKAEFEPEITRLEAEREEVAAGIDPRAMSLYKLLRQRRAGVAVAKLERGMCGGCRITLPSATLTKARSGTELVQCVSCERILVV